jgi:dephospho-CoA kinase
VKEGVLDRAGLGSYVFSHRAARRRLESVTHRLILKEMDRLLSRMRGVVVVDVPLLFEAGLSRRFDVSVAVTSKHQTKRVMERDGLSAAQVRGRLAAQWPQEKKAAAADIVLDNDGTKKELDKKVARLDAGLQLLYGGTR